MKLIADIEGRRQEFLLKEGTNVIGRDVGCDITLLAKSISRRHVVCTVQGQRIFLRDLGSRNGTFVHEQSVQEAEVKPGDPVRLGRVAVRFALGAPAGAAPPQGVPEMPPEVVVPPSASYHEDSEPTPVDLEFGPSTNKPTEEEALPLVEEPPPAEPQPLVPVQAGAPAPAETVASRPARRPLTRREKLIFIVPAVAVFLVVAAVLLSSFTAPPPPDDVLGAPAYNRRIDRAVRAYREGRESEALALLADLAGQKIQGDPRTHEILEEAIELDRNLDAPEIFGRNWLQAKSKWDELNEHSQSTAAARDLAAERVRWIIWEGRNKERYRFRKLAGEGLADKALETARELLEAEYTPDRGEKIKSIFAPLVAEKATALRADLVADALSRARRARARQAWDAAIRAYEEAERHLDKAVPPEVVREKDQCLRNRADQQRLQRAARWIDQGEETRARQELDRVDPNGPYAGRLAELRERIATAAVRKQALTLYRSMRADDALEVLRKAGLERSALAVRIREVRDLWAKVQEASKSNDFQTAKGFCQAILQKEPDPANRYHMDAKRYIADAPALQKALAEKTRDRGRQALEAERFKEARDLFEEARQIDPKGQIGVAEIEDMKRKAVREYNEALYLQDRDPPKALEKFRRVLARLRPTDKYYDLTLERIRRLEKKD